MQHFTNWDAVVPINHGYDETKQESELDIADMQKVVEFLGGRLLSTEMNKGDWSGKLEFQCAFVKRSVKAFLTRSTPSESSR